MAKSSGALIEVVRAAQEKPLPPESELQFGKHFSDHMLQMEYASGAGWHGGRVVPYGPLQLDPAAAVLHYGQALFEGMKAFRTVDGSVKVFRLDDHCKRLASGAPRLCIPAVPVELAREGILELLRIEKRWVPTSPGTALYLRPTIIATEGFLGVRPAERYLFFVICSPVGAYYAGGQSAVKIWVEQKYVRAPQGGLGAVKAGANYAASLLAATEAKQRGYSQVLWLDARERRYIEEVGTMNLFVRIGDEVITPPLDDGTLLGGMTRASVLQLLRAWGVPVKERRVSVDELREAHAAGRLNEVFGTGTAAVISPVNELGFAEGTLKVGDGTFGEIAQRLYDTVTGVQRGTLPDTFGWMTSVD